jgi:16S rRNA (cytidine1402-2'-O)-methyltransferase
VSVAGLEDTLVRVPGSHQLGRKTELLLPAAKRLHADATLVFFEAPHRIRQTLRDCSIFGKQPIFVFRELTKIHEETLTGSPSELAETLERPQGEFTVVVPMEQAEENQQLEIDSAAVIRVFGCLTEKLALSKRAIAREVGKEFGLSTRQVYELVNKSPE